MSMRYQARLNQLDIKTDKILTMIDRLQGTVDKQEEEIAKLTKSPPKENKPK